MVSGYLSSPHLMPNDNKVHAKPTTKLSAIASGLIYVMATGRIATSCFLFFVPQTASIHFKLGTLPGTTLAARLFGLREGVIGGLTMATVANHDSENELRRILWAGVAIDTLDAVSCLLILASSDTTEVSVAKSTLGVAISVALMGLLAIKSSS
jgi:hypothetical protein